MGYQKTLNPDRALELSPILQALEELPGGEFLELEDHPESINALRSALYIWFREQGTKSLYRIERMGTTKILVKKRAGLQPAVRSSMTEQALTFVRDHLLEVEDETEVRHILDRALARGELDGRASVQALAEWRRVFGASTEPSAGEAEPC